MALSKGDRLGPYEILALVGKGGMGEVYRAHDDRLRRDVAIKLSKDEFTERFTREARAIASLNHTNICHLYDVGPNYLVMEYVEGEDLKGPLDFSDALPIIQQLIDGIEAAHEKNIIHRDLKPANIKITPDGVVKILDFGLAKAMEPPASFEADAGNSPTLTMGATVAGTILGTAAYMAPEQAKGKSADKRSDVWSFGVVVYEMLTGKRLFPGESVVEILGGVLNRDADVSAAPARVHKLLGWCLEKDRKKRLASISDARLALNRDGEEADKRDEVVLPAPSRSRLSGVVAATATLAFFALAAWTFYPRPIEPAHVVKTIAMLPEGVTLQFDSPPAVSPDGRRIVFAANKGGTRALWVRDLDALDARMLPGTERAIRPFWAPDSRQVGFFATPNLKKIDVTGGPALTVADIGGFGGGSWSANGVIVFTGQAGTGVQRVPAAGGAPTKIVDRPGTYAPFFLPDGRHFLYTGSTKEDTEPALYIGDVQAAIAENAKNGSALVHTASNAVYAEPGYLLFVRERTLMSQPFDAAKLTTAGDAVPVAEQVDYTSAPTAAQFSVSRNGVLVYASGGAGANSQLTWFDRSGKNLGTVGPLGEMQWAALSPDGNTVAFDRRNGSNFDIWLFDLVRGAESRFTFGPKGINDYPVWSPDGTHLAFSSSRGTSRDIYQRALGGTAMDEILDADESTKRPTDWSQDGKFLIEESGSGSGPTRNDVWMLPASAEKKEANKPVAVLHSEFQEGQGKLSPDGHWLAYRSDESGSNEIYVTSFPTPTAKSKISTGGGSWPVWSRDGRELYFVGSDRRLRAVPVKSVGEKFEAGVPVPLFEVRLSNNGRYDVSKDGRFLVPMQIEQSTVVPLTIVQNWQSGLK
jgi:eukaryotic-like serine/threonine-protein kinase